MKGSCLTHNESHLLRQALSSRLFCPDPAEQPVLFSYLLQSLKNEQLSVRYADLKQIFKFQVENVG